MRKAEQMSTSKNLRASLDQAKSTTSSLSSLAELYEEAILEEKYVPDDAWWVIEQIFNDTQLLKRRGVERFLIELNVDLPKYSPAQLQALLQSLLANTKSMEHEIARHASGDFIARAYPQEIAFRSLAQLAKGTAREKHAAFVGLDILQGHAEGELRLKIDQLLDQLLESNAQWRGDA
jgi:hypothetical protein